MKKIYDDGWFYSEPGLWRFALIYVKGDGLILIPLVTLIIFAGYFDIRLSLFMAFTYFTFRGLGEMIYWLLQQFGAKTYRPNDYGFTDLSNDAIYILYQVSSLANMVLGITGLYLLLR